MKVKVIKDHHHYGMGHHDVDNARGEYLVKMGIAEKIDNVDEVENKMMNTKPKENKIPVENKAVKPKGKKKS